MAKDSTYDMKPLLDALGRGDLELRFRDGRSIKAHSQKLSLASNGILRDLLEDVLDGEIFSRRTDLEGGATPSAIGSSTPGVMVSYGLGSLQHMAFSPQIVIPSMQVDGEYEDWLEVLRLMYYSGGHDGRVKG